MVKIIQSNLQLFDLLSDEKTLFLQSDKILPEGFNTDLKKSCLERAIVFGCSNYFDYIPNQDLMKALNQRGIDSLTGIYNRGKFDDDLKKTVESKREVDEEFSLVMFDIDDFKSVNDKHGHDVGDEVLRYVARVIPKHIKRVRWFL